MQGGELPRRVEKPWGHAVEVLGDAVVVEVSTPELDDVVRLTDDYGRAGTSAP